jgi:hypothetical protein
MAENDSRFCDHARVKESDCETECRSKEIYRRATAIMQIDDSELPQSLKEVLRGDREG